MSNIYEIRREKKKCDTTGDCARHDTLMQQERQGIDADMTAQNQLDIAGGIFIGVVGLLLIAAGFSRKIRHVQQYLLLGLLIIMPVAVGFLLGVYGALSAAFTGCIMGICSVNWNMFGFYGPSVVVMLIFSVVAVFIYKKRAPIMAYITRIKSLIWVLAGLLVIAAGFMATVQNLKTNAENNQIRKYNLSRYM